MQSCHFHPNIPQVSIVHSDCLVEPQETCSWPSVKKVGILLPAEGTAADFYKGLIRINYTNPVLVDIELFGRMVHILEDGVADGEDRRLLWDLSLRRRLYKNESVEAGIFVMIHNLTDGVHYWSRDFVNPGRSFEAGLRQESRTGQNHCCLGADRGRRSRETRKI